MPAAIVVTAECDPSATGANATPSARVTRVQTTLTRYPGSYHGLMRSDAVARGRLAVAEIGGLLRAKFAHPLPF